MKNLPILVSLSLYALSLASPAFLFVRTFSFSSSSPGSPDSWSGFTILLVGWMGCFLLQFGWLANPLYFLSLYFLWVRRWRATLVSSGIAIAVAAANTLLLFHQTLPGDEAGVAMLNLQRLEVGYYLWAIALLIPLVWSIAQVWRTR